MKKQTLFVLAVFTMIFVNAQKQSNTGNFSLRLSSAIGFPALSKINGGAFKGPNVNTDGSGNAWYNFKIQPVYVLLGGYARRERFEFGLELGKATFKSDVTMPYGQQQISYLKYLLWNFDTKYYVLKESKQKFSPFIDGCLNAMFQSYSDKRTGYDESSSANLYLRLGGFVGTDYQLNNHFSATGKVGIGAFEFFQFGIKYNFKSMSSK